MTRLLRDILLAAVVTGCGHPAPAAPPPAEVTVGPIEKGTETDAVSWDPPGPTTRPTPPTTDCVDDPDIASLPEGEIREKLHSATCLYTSAKLLDATAAARIALELGTQQKDIAVMKIARKKMVDLVERTPHFTFVRPRGVTLTSLTVDNRAIPLHAVEQKHAFDPGRHHIVATGLAGTRSVSMRTEENLAERRVVQIQLDLR